MAQVTDRRWRKNRQTGERESTGYNGPSPWQARWRDPQGAQKTQAFARKVDAEQHLTSVGHRMLIGEYVDPQAGKVTVKGYAEEWRLRQVHRTGTQVSVEHRLRLHVYPMLGTRQMRSVRPSDVQSWVTAMSTTLAPGTVHVLYRMVAAIFRDAARDRVIGRSPCDGIKLPKRPKSEVTPPTVDQVELLAGTIHERYRAAVILAAGAGLRLGEVFGLELRHVDFLRRTLRVEQQLLTEKGGPRIGPTKTTSSVRTVHLADAVVAELSEHVRKYPPVDGRLISNELDNPIRASAFQKVWRKAGRDTSITGVRFHDLRHFYASALISAGCSVVAVQNALGHASATETLNTYAHLWPSDEDRTRDAIQGILTGAASISCATDVQRAADET